MTERIRTLLQNCIDKRQRTLRQPMNGEAAAVFQDPALSPTERTALRLEMLLQAERPAVEPMQKIVFQRTVTDVPGIFTEQEFAEIRKTHFIHELGNVSNISPHYDKIIGMGFEKLEEQIYARLVQCQREQDRAGEQFLAAILRSIRAVCDLCDRYRQQALAVGNAEVAEILSKIPRKPAESFLEALQFFRILHYTLWAEGEYHNTIGRFDQYMFPYLQQDLECGRLTEEDALELLEEFFITFNLDSDIYPGVQQGDDGQSLMLGGITREGTDAINLLSFLCLRASRELKLIDPKINLRVNKNTPLSLFEEGTLLTKEGLGFPQYSNDDIVIPGLVDLGYTLTDARDYTVAACWEFIIPGAGMDVCNIGALSFPKVVNAAMDKYLDKCKDFDEFMGKVGQQILQECNSISVSLDNLYFIPAPFMSILMDGCVKNAKDISLGGVYNNYGFHGTGIATAADSLAAIQRLIFKEKSLTAKELIHAVQNDFKGYEALQQELRYEMPKMGCDDDEADTLAGFLLESFAQALKGKKNQRGGCFRAGTASAMFYLRHAAQTPASADGRSGGEPFGANFTPSLFARTKGPISVIHSFTKFDLKKTINGGPLTMEFHSTLFRDKESITKVAQLVKYFIQRGGHQLQLNAVNRDAMLDAQKHPDKYAQLVVRIWGWSAYFTQLDKEYQDHVIARQEYAV